MTENLKRLIPTNHDRIIAIISMSKSLYYNRISDVSRVQDDNCIKEMEWKVILADISGIATEEHILETKEERAYP